MEQVLLLGRNGLKVWQYLCETVSDYQNLPLSKMTDSPFLLSSKQHQADSD
jgi:hypothetical protein